MPQARYSFRLTLLRRVKCNNTNSVAQDINDERLLKNATRLLICLRGRKTVAEGRNKTGSRRSLLVAKQKNQGIKTENSCSLIASTLPTPEMREYFGALALP